jgi:hypothetical protein
VLWKTLCMSLFHLNWIRSLQYWANSFSLKCSLSLRSTHSFRFKVLCVSQTHSLHCIFHFFNQMSTKNLNIPFLYLNEHKKIKRALYGRGVTPRFFGTSYNYSTPSLWIEKMISELTLRAPLAAQSDPPSLNSHVPYIPKFNDPNTENWTVLMDLEPTLSLLRYLTEHCRYSCNTSSLFNLFREFFGTVTNFIILWVYQFISLHS